MREADIDGMGISIGGRNLTNLRYADDTALIADNVTSMKRILNRVDIAGRKASLKLNAKKTKVRHINDTNNPANDIKEDNSKLEYVQCFKYLGSVKENNGSCSKDVRTRIGIAKQKTIELNNIWKDRGILTTLKMAILKCLVWPVVLYGCEAWTLKQEQNRIHAIEMWLHGRLLRVSWKEKRNNDKCDIGYYGDGCIKSCSDHCAGKNNSCNHINGTCDLGCVPGYQGTLCTQAKLSTVFNTTICFKLQKMGFPTHLISLISNLYTNQSATIRWNGEHSGHFHINKGVRQGCILSPHLFSIYTEQVMREADIDGIGISIGGRNLTNLRYADDTALIADNVTSMKRILNRVDIAGRKASLKLNAKKTKVMYINDTNNTANDIKVDNSKLEYVQCFKYLGSLKENNGSCSKDVRTIIDMAKQKTIESNNIWKDMGIPTTLKMAILKRLVWPVVLYGCEAWTLKQEEQNRIHATEMWLYRRLLRVSWKEKRTNDSILKELGVTRKLLSEIHKRRLRYTDHAIRNTKTDLMKPVLQGKFAGKKGKGRPPTTLIDNIEKSSGLSLHQISQRSRDRNKWRAVVMSAGDPIDEHGDGYK
ncbi:hypothetical protein EGW08_022297 [Elysia chlorotica]|uniref:Reverse transcriptase domain-containing protein n=1 Tax=Elysia chlorotica TaxID=188477 RepID=A0A3S0Z5S0_ELYCH|nr:hypothetical protein EGW08_022297 [Elysia chlorotica]